MYIYFWEKNRKLNNKNLPTNPANGGIPDIDKKISTVVIETKLYLFKTFKLFNVFIFFISYKNNKEKNKNNKYIYIHIFKYIIDIP
jgi:hypothetical protein